MYTHKNVLIRFYSVAGRHTSYTEIYYNNVGRRRVGLSFLYLHLVSTASALSDNSIDPYNTIYLYPSLSLREMDNYDDDDDDKPSTHTADIIIYITIARVHYLTFTHILIKRVLFHRCTYSILYYYVWYF